MSRIYKDKIYITLQSTSLAVNIICGPADRVAGTASEKFLSKVLSLSLDSFSFPYQDEGPVYAGAFAILANFLAREFQQCLE